MEAKNKNNTYNTLFHWNGFRLKLVLEAIVVCLITGLIVALYRYLLDKAGVILIEFYKALSARPLLIPVWIGVLIVIGYAVGLLVKHEPMIRGSGVPQVEAVLLGKLDISWWRVILGKLVGGVLTTGLGLSIGPEGPSVQLGAAVGQGFSRVFKRIKIEEKYLVTCGSSAGLAAIFNAPLAGLMFALEEFHKNFSPLVLLSALSAVMSADIVTSEFFGLKPILDFKSLTVMPIKYYSYILVLGVILGVLGMAFNKTILKTQDLYTMQKWLPKEFWIIIPLLISVILGFFLPQVLGSGNELVTSLIVRNIPLTMLLALLFIKFLFTMVSYGSGAPGGLYMPLLAIGGLIGNIYGVVVVHYFYLNSIYISNFILLAMAGYFTAVFRTPLTATFLITEMTGSFDHLLSFVVVSFGAYMVADLLGSKPLNESLLERILQTHGEEIGVGNEKNKSLLEFAVFMGSMVDGKQIKEMKWPENCLLVAVKHGGREIIPTGDTVIHPGDYLIVLTNEDKAAKINDTLSKMTREYEIYCN